jgi:hypothetical protein
MDIPIGHTHSRIPFFLQLTSSIASPSSDQFMQKMGVEGNFCRITGEIRQSARQQKHRI